MADHITKTAVHLDAFQWLGGSLVGFTLPIWAKPLALHTPGDGNLHVIAGVGDRIDDLRRRSGEHEIDLIRVDQRLGELAGARRIGLGVPIENLHLVGLVAHREAGGQSLARDLEHVAVGLAEAAQGAGARADEADFQRVFGAGGESAANAKTEREPAGATECQHVATGGTAHH